MSDATDRASALERLLEFSQPGIAPTLTTGTETDEVETILDRNKRASTWAVNTAYKVGDVIMPPIRNGHRYRCVRPGTSQATDPGYYFWSLTSGITMQDGVSNPILTWQEDGPEFANIYDVRQATYECWSLRASKAAQ